MKPECRNQFSDGSFFFCSSCSGQLLWTALKIQAQGVIATLLCLPLWEYVWENKNSCFELFSTVTCNPPCEHGRCIDNTSNNTKCYCVIGWEGQFCNKSNGGESTRSKQALAYKRLKLWMLQAMVFTCSADLPIFDSKLKSKWINLKCLV